MKDIFLLILYSFYLSPFSFHQTLYIFHLKARDANFHYFISYQILQCNLNINLFLYNQDFILNHLTIHYFIIILLIIIIIL